MFFKETTFLAYIIISKKFRLVRSNILGHDSLVVTILQTVRLEKHADLLHQTVMTFVLGFPQQLEHLHDHFFNFVLPQKMLILSVWSFSSIRA